jgi:hypothetical protein
MYEMGGEWGGGGVGGGGVGWGGNHCQRAEYQKEFTERGHEIPALSGTDFDIAEGNSSWARAEPARAVDLLKLSEHGQGPLGRALLPWEAAPQRVRRPRGLRYRRRAGGPSVVPVLQSDAHLTRIENITAGRRHPPRSHWTPTNPGPDRDDR